LKIQSGILFSILKNSFLEAFYFVFCPSLVIGDFQRSVRVSGFDLVKQVGFEKTKN